MEVAGRRVVGYSGRGARHGDWNTVWIMQMRVLEIGLNGDGQRSGHGRGGLGDQCCDGPDYEMALDVQAVGVLTDG